jgi:hypothetical protein
MELAANSAEKAKLYQARRRKNPWVIGIIVQ